MPAAALTAGEVSWYVPMIAFAKPQTDLAFPAWQRAELEKDILARGVIVPVVKDEDGHIIDGIVRAEIAERHGLTYPSDTVVGLTDAEKAAYRISLNLHRRHLHLTPKRKRELIADALRKCPSATDTAVARLFGVSDKTVGSVRRSTPEISEVKRLGADGKLRRRPIRIMTNSRREHKVRELIPFLNQSSEGKILDEITAKRRATVNRKKAAREEWLGTVPAVTPEDFPIYNCRFQDAPIESGTVDLVYVNPPWQFDWLPQLADLAEFANRVLKDNGLLAVVYGTLRIDQMLSTISPIIPFRSMLSASWSEAANLTFHDGTVILNAWRPISVFCKGQWPFRRRFSDHYHSATVEKEKHYHDWQQSLPYTRYFVQMLSEPGYLVCDPCSGSGTTMIAAAECDRRRFVGCEVDPAAYQASIRRRQEWLAQRDKTATVGI